MVPLIAASAFVIYEIKNIIYLFILPFYLCFFHPCSFICACALWFEMSFLLIFFGMALPYFQFNCLFGMTYQALSSLEPHIIFCHICIALIIKLVGYAMCRIQWIILNKLNASPYAKLCCVNTLGRVVGSAAYYRSNASIACYLC